VGFITPPSFFGDLKMKKLMSLMVLLVVLMTSIVAYADATYTNRKVLMLMSPDSRDTSTSSCLFFSVSGSDIGADPVFAVPKSQNGYKEILSILLSAKISNTPVSVIASSATSCSGHRAVYTVYFE
jgi:hypothetical protein